MNQSDSNEKNGTSRRRFLLSSAGVLMGAAYMSTIGSADPVFASYSKSKPTLTAYICPPCGEPCDKLTFDAPGTCPHCGMTLIAKDGKDSPPRVAILLFNGAELIDFAGPWEVFGTAGFLVHTVAEKAEPMTMVFGQKVIPDYTFDMSPKPDILLVPGGGVFDYLKDDKFIGWVQTKAQEASHVISVCTGAFILQKAGLLVGQTVTSTYGMIEDLASPDTKVIYDRRFVDSGKIITTAGLSSGIDGAFHLVSKILGSGAAQAAALDMEYPWDPNGEWARAALADRYLPDGLAYGKAKLKGVNAKLISTGGNTESWEIKLLVSSPTSASEITDVLRERIAANTASQGMFKSVPHLRGKPDINTKSGDGSITKWRFTDDQGRRWRGFAKVDPSSDDRGKFVLSVNITATA